MAAELAPPLAADSTGIEPATRPPARPGPVAWDAFAPTDQAARAGRGRIGFSRGWNLVGPRFAAARGVRAGGGGCVLAGPLVAPARAPGAIGNVTNYTSRLPFSISNPSYITATPDGTLWWTNY